MGVLCQMKFRRDIKELFRRSHLSISFGLSCPVLGLSAGR